MDEWRKDELAVAVSAYRTMQAAIAAGSKVNKAQVYRDLSSQHGRTPKSWEYRMQNISHVLAEFGKSWIEGLKPASNVGPTATNVLVELLFDNEPMATATVGATNALLTKESILADNSAAFIPEDVEDQRRRVLASIVRRRGQSQFRKKLLDTYDSRCAVTQCDAVDALEAAHIHPYLGDASNDVTNGLLLRADVHTLFDLYLISIDPDSMRVALSPQLRQSSYALLEGRTLGAPRIEAQAVSSDSLRWHRRQCSW